MMITALGIRTPAMTSLYSNRLVLVFPINQFPHQILDRDLVIPHPGVHHRKLGDHHPLNRKVNLFHHCSMTHLQEIHFHLHHRNHLLITHHQWNLLESDALNLKREPHLLKWFTNWALVMLLQKKKASLLKHGCLPDSHWKRRLLNSRQDHINTISTEMWDHSLGHLSKSEDLLAFLCHGYYPIMHTGIDLLLKLSKISNRALMQSRRRGW